MSEINGFFCETCGQYHEGIPMDFGLDFPEPFFSVPEAERKARCQWNSDYCVIDNKEYFVRGCLEIPVIDGTGPFVWGVWVSLSEKNFNRTVELQELKGRENETPYFGWFCNTLPLYPETFLLKTHVHTRPVGQRPFIELEPNNHPLAVEQRNGITMKRVRELVELLLHPKK